MKVLETRRLVLRELHDDHAGFLVELLNDPAFLRYVGDKGVRTEEDARRYVREGPVASYEEHGFGLYLVERKDGGAPVGICGLLQRETLDDPDVGFAFLPAYRSRGYATESAAAMIAYGRRTLGLERLVAITSPDNGGSIRVLEKLGFVAAGRVDVFGDGDDVALFVADDRAREM